MNNYDNDGCSIDEIFNDKIGYSYDDIIILPGYINFSVKDIVLKTQITKIYLYIIQL